MVSTLFFLYEILFLVFAWLTDMYRLAQMQEWKFVPQIRRQSSLLSYTLEWCGQCRTIQLLKSIAKSPFHFGKRLISLYVFFIVPFLLMYPSIKFLYFCPHLFYLTLVTFPFFLLLLSDTHFYMNVPTECRLLR